VDKVYKFRLCRKDDQINLINKPFGCARFIYNYFLDTSFNKICEMLKWKMIISTSINIMLKYITNNKKRCIIIVRYDYQNLSLWRIKATLAVK